MNQKFALLVAFIVVMAAGLSACGQKGPLYLPQPAKPVVKPAGEVPPAAKP